MERGPYVVESLAQVAPAEQLAVHPRGVHGTDQLSGVAQRCKVGDEMVVDVAVVRQHRPVPGPLLDPVGADGLSLQLSRVRRLDPDEVLVQVVQDKPVGIGRLAALHEQPPLEHRQHGPRPQA